MSDRHRHHHPAKRSSTFNPARASLPNGIGYGSSYADDSYLVPSSRHPTTTPRGYATTTNSSGIPTTTRTYAVSQDPRSRSAARDGSRTRRSTLDSATRPPVIVTTTQKDRGHNSYPHAPNPHDGSPSRGGYRSSDSSYYALPATSNRSRSSTRRYFDEDQGRYRDRNDGHLSARDAETYRSTRPSVTYPSEPRHSTAAVDYGDEGYRYTNAGELVRYDLDQSRPSHSRRHESFDRGYYRPRAAYHGDSRRSEAPRYDNDRGYIVNPSRHHDSRAGGPPPTTRGFDKINRNYDMGKERDLPPTAPKPPAPKPSSHPDSGGAFSDTRHSRHGRPTSVVQDRGDADETRSRKDLRDRARERDMEDGRRNQLTFYDDGVHSRGFGIRPGQPEILDNRRDWQREPRRGDSSAEQDGLGTATKPERASQRESHDENKRGTVKDDSAHGHVREGLATGLGISAAAVGLVPPRDVDRTRGEGRGVGSPTSRDEQLAWRRDQVDGEGPSHARRHADDAERYHRRPEDGIDDEGTGKLEGGVKVGTNDAAPSASDSDDGRRGRALRRHRPSSSFDPNDTGDLRQIKEQLAAMRVASKEDLHDDMTPTLAVSRVSRSTSPRKSETVDEERAREVGFPVSTERQVRVVSPPREKRDERPLRGILKHPSASFPEETNPIREGVAPHKEDKKLKEVPPGARWTKINRKIVNPEALSIGKERFEVRDDFVIVLRVLSKEEIQAYASATQILRERRRNPEYGDRGANIVDDPPGDEGGDEEESSHPYRHRRRQDDEDYGDDLDNQGRERDRESGGRAKSHRDDHSRSMHQDEPDHHRSHRVYDNDGDD